MNLPLKAFELAFNHCVKVQRHQVEQRVPFHFFFIVLTFKRYPFL